MTSPQLRKPRTRRQKVTKNFWRTTRWFLAFYFVIAVLSYLTNPFTKYTTVQEPFQTQLNPQGQLELVKNFSLHLRTNRLYKSFTWLKSAQHIFDNAYSSTKKSKSSQVNEIIADIHRLRFDPDEPYLISGDHFSTLYPRSLGIFYHSLLDPRTALDTEDWLHRQQIYSQTAAYALEAYKHAPNLSTTIVPVGPQSVSLMNIYRPPSDTLYSLLYALRVMRDDSEITTAYPYKKTSAFLLNTQEISQQLLNTYHDSLTRHLSTYLAYVRDSQTGLIRTDIMLSGTKDVAQRQSSFYDNVILWKTLQLSQELGLIEKNTVPLDTLKQTILEKFWMKSEGCFLEDLSDEAAEGRYYSSDWLIVLSTQFLDPRKPEELEYYQRCVEYIQKHSLDQPFGLKYQQKLIKSRQYPVVRWLAPEYGSTTIWSNWGQEYIKSLVWLYLETKDAQYLKTAEAQLDAYTEKILQYRCYPEVYNDKGEMYQHAFYKSVCQTGWVVSYEQAREMVGWAKNLDIMQLDSATASTSASNKE